MGRIMRKFPTEQKAYLETTIADPIEVEDMG